MPASLTMALAGQPVQLLAERALFWPARRWLLIADLHLGKGEALRRGGIAVPRGGTREDLQRLHLLVEQTGAVALHVLGDFLHGASEGAWRDDWHAWRAQHANLTISIVAGNHDRRLARNAEAWEVALHPEGESHGPFEFRHMPRETAAHVIAGHVHPRVRYPGLPGRWPAFLLWPRMTILPAFSLFTGGANALPGTGAHAIACLDGLVAALPWEQHRRD